MAQSRGSRLRFSVGVGLVAASYPLWAAAALFGALALRGHAALFGRLAVGSLVLNWGCFSMGLVMAGRRGMRFVRDRMRTWWRPPGAVLKRRDARLTTPHSTHEDGIGRAGDSAR